MSTTIKERLAGIAAVAALLVGCVACFCVGLGLVPVYIIVGPGLIAVWFWYRTYLKHPTDPATIVPAFLVTVAGFEIHLIEEYLGHYAPAISRLFNIGWADQTFVVICLLLSAVLCLVSVGLCCRNAIAGFVAILFLFTRLAELGLFIFPLLRPALHADVGHPISQSVASGTFVANMPNHYWRTVGGYYFPGMYTVALTILPALYTLYRIWHAQDGDTSARVRTWNGVLEEQRIEHGA